MVRMKNHFFVLVTFLLISALVSGSFFNVRKAYAIAPAVPAAGAAVAAVAAELGISETALLAGAAAIGVAATGMAATGYMYDSQNAVMPGYKPWDQLSPQEKNTWGDYSPGISDEEMQENYVHNQLANTLANMGLLAEVSGDGGGGFEPTPEPDPENDPDGYARWHKARNALIALAIGGASIPLSDAVNAYADNLSAGLKGLLFGTGNDSFGIKYQANILVNNAYILFIYADTPNAGSNDWFLFYQYQPSLVPTTAWYFKTNGISQAEMVYADSGVKFSRSYNYWPTDKYTFSTSEWIAGTSNFNSGNALPSVSQNAIYALNANWSGTYVFPDGNYQQGVVTGTLQPEVDYGQMQDTPEGLANNIMNQVAYNNFVNNYTNNTGEQDTQRTVTIPSGFGLAGYTPKYSDFVKVTPDEDVTPIPDDGPLPGPNPNPNPGGDSQFQEDYGQQVVRLLAQPFDQLFPFCLIGDLHRFVDMMADAGNPQAQALMTQGERTVNGTENLLFPLRDFGVDGLDDIEIDLTPVHDLAAMVRGPLTGLFICGLIVGTFRFFLTRGGE